jgi:hypothetical protein
MEGKPKMQLSIWQRRNREGKEFELWLNVDLATGIVNPNIMLVLDTKDVPVESSVCSAKDSPSVTTASERKPERVEMKRMTRRQHKGKPSYWCKIGKHGKCVKQDCPCNCGHR